MGRNMANITSEIEAIESQIKMFSELTYSAELITCSDGGSLYPLSGLDADNFSNIRASIINMLNDVLIKKYEELKELCEDKLNLNDNTEENHIKSPVVSIDINKIKSMSNSSLMNHLIALYSCNAEYRNYYKEDEDIFNDDGILLADELRNEVMSRMH